MIKIVYIPTLAFSLLFLFSCGGRSMKSSFDEGKLFKKWSFDKIEPYKEDQKDEEFMLRIKVTPIELDFSESASGEFTAFFPNLNWYDADYLISRDAKGKVKFDVRDNVIIVEFTDIESEFDLEMKNLRIIEFTGESFAFEMGDGNGNLYHVFMK
jgi:hypothetical protein